MSRPGGDSGGGRSSSECAAQTERRPARAREGARSRLKGGPRTLTGAGLAVDALTCLHAGPAPFLPRAGPAPCLTRARTEDRVSVDAPACLHTGLAPFLPRGPRPLPAARTRTDADALCAPPVARTRSGTRARCLLRHPRPVARTRNPPAGAQTLSRAPVTRTRAPLPPYAPRPRLARARALGSPGRRSPRAF